MRNLNAVTTDRHGDQIEKQLRKAIWSMRIQMAASI